MYTFFIKKIPNKQELQQIVFNHSSDIGFDKLMNLYTYCIAKLYYFIVIDSTPAWDNSLRFRHNLLERIFKLVMIIDDNIKDEKLQYNIDREASKLSALSPGTIDKYEYMTSEDILPSDQSRIIEPSNFTYSPLGKAFRKQQQKKNNWKQKTSWILKSFTINWTKINN